MTKHIGTTGLLAAAIVVTGGFALPFALPGDASAQTATNLICRGCVGTRDIRNKAVTSKKIRNGQVKPVDLHRSAKPAAANFSSVNGEDAGTLPTTDTVVAQVTMNLPAPGVVIANAGGWAVFNDNPSSILCAISKTTSTSGQPFIIAQNHNEANARRMPTPVTRGFVEDTAGSHTYYFVCRTHLGSSGHNDAMLTTVYVPQLSGPVPTSASAEGAAGNSVD